MKKENKLLAATATKSQSSTGKLQSIIQILQTKNKKTSTSLSSVQQWLAETKKVVDGASDSPSATLAGNVSPAISSSKPGVKANFEQMLQGLDLILSNNATIETTALS